MAFAAALAVIFGAVVFSVPPERLAWHAPLVMGALSLPKPNPAKIYRSDARESSDPLFSFMGFLSVSGILGLVGRKLTTKSSPGSKTKEVPLPLTFP